MVFVSSSKKGVEGKVSLKGHKNIFSDTLSLIPPEMPSFIANFTVLPV